MRKSDKKGAAWYTKTHPAASVAKEGSGPNIAIALIFLLSYCHGYPPSPTLSRLQTAQHSTHSTTALNYSPLYSIYGNLLRQYNVECI